MKLDVPGSVSPLDLSYEMGLAGSTVNLSAEISGKVWENALGVENLVLEDTLFTLSFPSSKPWRSFAFDVSATFWYLTSPVSLMGSYASDGQFSLTAGFDKFGTEEIDSIFSTLFSDSLSLPDFAVEIGSASLSVVSGTGLSVSLFDVVIADYTARKITVTFNTSGASLSGALSSKLLPFGEVGLRNGVVQLAFWSSNKKKQVEFMLGGLLTVDFLGVDVKAVVHLYPIRGGFAWAVLAELAASQQPFAISDVVRDIKDSFLDFSLKNVLFIATPQDNLAVENLYPEYRIRKGVQVLGVIDRIPPLNTLLKKDVRNLVFSAGWSKVSGFNLAVSLPAASSLDLGNGIRTKPISLAIRTKPVELAVVAGLTVSVKDSTPLDFSFVLAANLTGASASAEMKGWWVKPFLIDNLKIGEIVLLSIEIIYAQFVSTGTPSGFGLAGGLKIGQVEAHIALNVSAEPRCQMLSARVNELGISDLVDFAGELIQERIPSIPANFFRFEELRVYICPFGIVQGTTTYPQGFSFRANMMFFEKRAEIECKIDQAEKSIGIAGSIQNFKLGPLSLRGSNGPQAELKCHLGVLRQQLVIDGVVSLFDLQSQTCVDMQFMPEPKFKFFVSLKFAKIFMFQLNAELIGSLGRNLDGADFSLHAELQNDILRYVAQQVIEEFEAAKVFAAKGLEAAQEKVKKAEKEWKAMITGAEKKVDEARKNWESYEKTVRSSSQPVIDKYLSEITRLQNNIEEARKAFESALQDARAAVEQANRDRGAALAAANRDIEWAKYDVDRGIAGAQRALDYARADLSAAFGSAQRAINSAQWEVWSLQNQIYHVKGIIREYERAPWYHFWKKAAIAGLWSAVWGLEASKAVASGILDAARAVLWSTEYLSKEGAVRAAQSALVAARETGRLSLSAAQGALTAADETSKFAVDRANNVLLGVEKGAQFAAFQGAIKALQVFKDANKVAHDVAVKAIEGLMDCAALTAFTLAKVGLKVAKTSTALLDAAKEGLALAKKATEKVIAVLKEMVRLGATALNITQVILSGSVREVFGTGGEKSRPLSAAVGGYFLGNRFDFKLEFNPKNFVAFFETIFKKLWDMITGSNSFSVITSDPEEDNQATARPASAYESGTYALMPSDVILDDSRHFTLARKRFAPVNAQVSSEAIDESVTISIPCSPFTGIPIFPPHVVISLADRMMQEDGLSVKRFGL
ncbi:hypothetical protein BDZ94DRAFT_1322048 [Collybia nuda]|uniref:Uncharacterized protein n=1 Tax=Collybia nuda TaxID=64659 RepID=A0A9P6CEM6_9AGAR|nr:hypothetical protein BDZ94DRAFT_1322048 [Collybia nuda]